MNTSSLRTSICFCTAMALTGYDTSALATFSSANCNAPELVALRDRVSVATDDSLPESAARVKIERSSKDQVVVRHDICDPMPVALRETKVRAKAAGLLGQDRAERCWGRIEELGTSDTPVNLRELAEL